MVVLEVGRPAAVASPGRALAHLRHPVVEPRILGQRGMVVDHFGSELREFDRVASRGDRVGLDDDAETSTGVVVEALGRSVVGGAGPRVAPVLAERVARELVGLAQVARLELDLALPRELARTCARSEHPNRRQPSDHASTHAASLFVYRLAGSARR